MRFLCDEMLARLGRWLRAAGYDTVIAKGVADDGALLELARTEDRVLLSRDRELIARGAGAVEAVRLESDRVPDQARELARHVAIDWLHAPFSRCVVDNALLEPAAAHETQAIPPKAQALGGPFSACPACGRLYWEGSHHKRMAKRLAAWQRPGA